MAPNRGPSAKSSKKKSPKAKGKPSTFTSASRVSKSSSKAKTKRPPAKEVKAKSRSAPEQLKKTKKRQYTEKELDLPTLNMITPVGVQKPRGKKKGKTFIDDQESMMTIFAIVNAEKEGQIESKMMKARQLEEIRESKRKEAESRQQQKKSKLEDIKQELRRKKKRKSEHDATDKVSNTAEINGASLKSKGKRKKVSFV
ncbi:60S ribosomal subunit assembly/export protein LOC1 [Elaphomyces granulatus]|jgi:60S ribosomal subunit assembly/export protein LOC1